MNLSLKAEIDEIWSRLTAQTHLQGAQRFSMSERILTTAIQRQRKARHLLEPWVAVADQGLHFLWWLFHYLGQRREEQKGSPAFYSLVGRVLHFGSAVRLLASSGYDQPSRSLQRTVSETIDLAIVILHDAELAQEYGREKTQEEQRQFWSNHVAYGRIHKRVAQVTKALGFDEESEWFAEDRRAQNDWLAGAVHSSSVSALFSTAIPSLEDPGHLTINPLGCLNTQTPGLIDDLAKEIHRFAAVVLKSLMSDDPPEVFVDVRTEEPAVRSLIAAFFLFQELLQRHYDDVNNQPDYFEEKPEVPPGA